MDGSGSSVGQRTGMIISLFVGISQVLPLNPLHTVQMLTTMIQKAETQFMHSNVSKNFSYQEKMDRLKDAVRRLHSVTRDLHLEAQVEQKLFG